MRHLVFVACLVLGLTLVASAQDAQQANEPRTLADLLPDEPDDGSKTVPDELPPSVERILSRAASRVARNTQDANKTNETVVKEESKNIEQELDRLTKAGQLEQALVTRKLLASFQDAVLLRAGQKANRPKPIAKDPRVTAVGRWTWPDGGTIELREDGMAFGSWHGEQGLWTIGPDGTIRMIVLKTRAVVTAKLAPDGKSMQVEGQGISRRLP